MSENYGLNIIFKAYRLHYGLTQEVVERLAKLKKNQYSRIESGRQEGKSTEIDAICSVYGLKNYQMANPKRRKPSLKNLPVSTQKAIFEIKQIGIQPRENQKKINLGKEIDNLISMGILDRPITAKKLLAFLPNEVKEKINHDSSRITDLLRRYPRNQIIKIVAKPEGEIGAGNWYQRL